MNLVYETFKFCIIFCGVTKESSFICWVLIVVEVIMKAFRADSLVSCWWQLAYKVHRDCQAKDER